MNVPILTAMMDLRQFVRGRVEWSTLESLAVAIAERYDRDTISVRFLEADNWLSTPMVVDEELFVKLITPQNTLVHSIFTTGRNLGAFSSGTEGFFEAHQTPYEMAKHELEATERMRELGVNAPEPIEAFDHEGYGVVVLEYLPSFRSIDELDEATAAEHAGELFESLRVLHEAGLAHGDLRAENVLVTGGKLYFIDATNVSDSAVSDATSYDLACALAALEPLIGATRAVEAALEHYSIDDLLTAGDFLHFVNIRPDHDFDAEAVRAQIDRRGF